jgi:hypothetical protein
MGGKFWFPKNKSAAEFSSDSDWAETFIGINIKNIIIRTRQLCLFQLEKRFFIHPPIDFCNSELSNIVFGDYYVVIYSLITHYSKFLPNSRFVPGENLYQSSEQKKPLRIAVK